MSLPPPPPQLLVLNDATFLKFQGLSVVHPASLGWYNSDVNHFYTWIYTFIWWRLKNWWGRESIFMGRLWWILTFSWFVINLKCKKHERLLPESYATARNRLLKLMESGAFTRSVFVIILFWSFSCARFNFDIINRHISWQQVLRMTGDLVL